MPAVKQSEQDRYYMAQVGVRTLAKLFGLTDQGVRYLIDRNIIAQGEDSKLDLGPSVYAYVQHLKRSKNLAPEGSARANEEEEKAKQASITRELKELELLREKRKLYRTEDVDSHVANMITVVRSKLLGLHSKVSPLIAPLLSNTDDYHTIEMLIKSEVVEALSELSAYSPPSFDDEEVDGDVLLMDEERQ